MKKSIFNKFVDMVIELTLMEKYEPDMAEFIEERLKNKRNNMSVEKQKKEELQKSNGQNIYVH